METRYFSRFHHDSGVTEVVAAPKGANTWLEPYHNTIPFWPVMAYENFFSKEYFCSHRQYPHYAFELVCEGELEVGKNGKTELLKSGEAAILIAGEDSTLKAGPCGFCRKTSCTFTGELVHVIFSAFHLTDTDKITLETPEQAQQLIKRLAELLHARIPGTEPEICGTGYQLRQLASASVPHGSSHLIERAKRLLTLSVPVKEEIRNIAHKLNTNVSTLEHLFRKQLGTTPRDYLSQLRMQTAAELLRSGNMRIGRIAERVGYEDPLAFSHAFKRVFGVSPREYRKQNS